MGSPAVTEKVRLRATVTFEYDADPANYEGVGAAAMAAIDQASFADDAALVVDELGALGYKVSVEVVGA